MYGTIQYHTLHLSSMQQTVLKKRKLCQFSASQRAFAPNSDGFPSQKRFPHLPTPRLRCMAYFGPQIEQIHNHSSTKISCHGNEQAALIGGGSSSSRSIRVCICSRRKATSSHHHCHQQNGGHEEQIHVLDDERHQGDCGGVHFTRRESLWSWS